MTDHAKINEATHFLEECKNISRQVELTPKVVYQLLKSYEISDEEWNSNILHKPLTNFIYWKLCLFNCENVSVLYWKNYWTRFRNGEKPKKFIKLYISLDRKHLNNGVKQLITFLSQENIVHSSKSTSFVRADNVIIRIDSNDHVSLKKIYKFIENNDYIQAGLNKVNPFLPTVGNIGIMSDDGRSYNGELSELIANYINDYKYWPINFSDFMNYVRSKKSDDEIFLSTFNDAFVWDHKYFKIIDEQFNRDNKTRIVIRR